MAESPTTAPQPAPIFSFERYLDRYGSHAFGVVSLLVIWFLIVRPELIASRATTQEIQKLADTLRETAKIIDQAAIRLERIEVNQAENRKP